MSLLVITRMITDLIVHSTKLLNSDWSRAVQLIPNSTQQEYLKARAILRTFKITRTY